MARGVAGSPGATPDREDPEPELLLSPCDSLFEGVLCRSSGRWPKGLAAMGYRPAGGLLILDRISPGKGMLGADGLRASERRRASSSAAASSFLFCSFKSTMKGISWVSSIGAAEPSNVLLERRKFSSWPVLLELDAADSWSVVDSCSRAAWRLFDLPGTRFESDDRPLRPPACVSPRLLLVCW